MAFGGAGCSLLPGVRAKRQLERDRSAVSAPLAEAHEHYANGRFKEAEQLFQRAIQEIQHYEDKHGDGFFHERLDEAQARVRAEQALREARQMMQDADAARRDAQYPDAQKHYQRARQKAQSCPGADGDRRMHDLADLATNALSTDEIRLGAKGYVPHAGQWMTKEEALAARMAEQGKKLHKGEWLTEAEIAKREQKDSAKAAAPTTKRAAQKPVKPPPPPKPLVYVLDDFEKKKVEWRVAAWGNEGKLSRIDRDGSMALKVDYTKRDGEDNKCAIQRDLPEAGALATRDVVLLDVANLSRAGLRLSLAFQPRDGSSFYETPGTYVKRGSNRDVSFDLRSRRFKCEATDWDYKSPLRGPETMGILYIMIYPRQPGAATVDNVRFVSRMRASAPKRRR